MMGKNVSNFLRTINKDQQRVVERLMEHEGSFLVYYPNPRPDSLSNNWFFVRDKDAVVSSSISFSIKNCRDLIDKGILVPEILEEEFCLQVAVGACDSQIYRLSLKCYQN